MANIRGVAYPAAMGKPPPNYKVGLARSAASRQATARRHQAEVWSAIVSIALLEEPRTLAEYATHLTGFGISTARGGPWTPGLVHRVMKGHGVTPKRLLERVTCPLPYVKIDWPTEVYAAYRQRIDAIDQPSQRTGQWLPLTQWEPAKCDLVRHAKYGEGQVMARQALGRYLCSFVGEDGSFEMVCPAVDLEGFRYFRSREERIAASKRARAWIFGSSA